MLLFSVIVPDAGETAVLDPAYPEGGRVAADCPVAHRHGAEFVVDGAAV